MNSNIIAIVAILLGTTIVPVVDTHNIHTDTIPNNIAQISGNGNTLYVGGDGPNNYTKIQDAIDNASDGDTVFVYRGSYEETIRIGTSISLVGEQTNTTIIDGGFSGTVVEIDADGVVVRNFTVTGGGGDIDEAGIRITSGYVVVHDTFIVGNEGTGISLSSASHCSISHNVLTDNRYGGISLTEASQFNNISHNDIQSGISGIYVSASNQQTIGYNRVANCSKGIYLEESSDTTLIGNHITDNEEGLFLYYAPGNTIICNNFISNVKNARFAQFCHRGFLTLNAWDENYWDDWIQVGVKIIFGVVYVPTFSLIGIFIPWINVDWHPAKEPHEWGH